MRDLRSHRIRHLGHVYGQTCLQIRRTHYSLGFNYNREDYLKLNLIAYRRKASRKADMKIQG